MADFSFSFDSDNPFAEPEAAPQTPPAAQSADKGTDAPSEVAPAEVAPALASSVNNDEFSLDSFDFAFEEGASVNDTLPTRNMPDEAPAPRQKTPGEAALADFDFGAPEIPEPLELESLELESLEVAEPEPLTPEITLTPEVMAPAEVAGETTTEVEIPQDDDASVPFQASPRPDKNAPSDLDEFNALVFDLSSPTTEIEDPIGIASSIGEDSADDMFAGNVVSEVATSNVSAFDTDDLFGEMPVAETDAQEVAPLETPDFAPETPVVEAKPQEDEPQFASEFSMPDELATDTEVTDTEVTDTEMTDTEMTDDVSDAGADISSSDVEFEQESEIEARPRKTIQVLSVAILGASGIGKNHARWFHRNGCRVAAFLGSSDDSTAQTSEAMAADFAFEGNAYTDLSELLSKEKPDIVCVATPPALHFGHVLQSLEAGAHVLCEKPLVYAPTRKFRENRDGAKELVKVAAKRNLVLGTQLQYGAATPILCKLAGLSPTDVGDFAMELETLNPQSPRDPRELWIDMGPHPISIAQVLAGPGAKLAEESISFEPYQDDDKTEVLVRFGINCADGRLLMVRAAMRALRNSDRQPRRRFSFNGHSVIYAPFSNSKGDFQAQFVAPDGYASVYSDPVDYLIGDFVRACRQHHAPFISGDFGRENLEWMLKVAGEK